MEVLVDSLADVCAIVNENCDCGIWQNLNIRLLISWNARETTIAAVLPLPTLSSCASEFISVRFAKRERKTLASFLSKTCPRRFARCVRTLGSGSTNGASSSHTIDAGFPTKHFEATSVLLVMRPAGVAYKSITFADWQAWATSAHVAILVVESEVSLDGMSICNISELKSVDR